MFFPDEFQFRFRVTERSFAVKKILPFNDDLFANEAFLRCYAQHTLRALYVCFVSKITNLFQFLSSSGKTHKTTLILIPQIATNLEKLDTRSRGRAPQRTGSQISGIPVCAFEISCLAFRHTAFGPSCNPRTNPLLGIL